MERIKDDTTMQYNSPEDGIDSLTGFLDMNHFFARAEYLRNQPLTDNHNPAIIFFDFNGMKNFNIRYGFSEGDKLIIDMSKVLKKYFNEENCCRISGDRFVVMTIEEGLDSKLFMVIEECKTINRGRNLPIRAGVYPRRLGNVAVAVACDRAKIASDTLRGKVESGIAYFTDDLLKASETKQYIIDNLERAISEKWIKVYYQPIVRAANGKVCDEEALARWIDPVRGFMSPGEFIPILEETKLIYKLDLFILDQVLARMKKQLKQGAYLVPISINISRSDFETCCIVEEIKKRVDKAGIPHEKITIEITESTVGSNLEYIDKQLKEFNKCGFEVWMDDYGSGYSSPLILQKMRFNTVKLDMEFLREFDKNENSRIILSSLVKLMFGLGMETVVEGVETAEQAEFLKEIGCTKLQGYYYCKPISLEQLQERYKNGEQIGFENPEETGYFSEIGKVNLYDPYLSVSEEDRDRDYFDTLPMAILQIDGNDMEVIRANKTFKEFFEENVCSLNQRRDIFEEQNLASFDADFLSKLKKCADDGQQIIMDMKTKTGKKIHILLKRIAVNPVNNNKALALAVLGISEENKEENSLSFANVARALSSDYLYLYYVNIKKQTFTEYTPDTLQSNLIVQRNGTNFFAESRKDVHKYIYEGDRKNFLEIFTRENVLGTIKKHGAFTHTYRLLINDEPVYVNMKAIDIGDGKHIIIGVNNIEAQMRHQEAWERLREEKIACNRIMALADNYIAFYSVDPETEDFFMFDASEEWNKNDLERAGKDFFKASAKDSVKVLWPDDINLLKKSFTKENVLKEIKEKGIYVLKYRLSVEGKPKYVCLKAAIVNEDDRDTLIVGLSDIDSQVRQEREYAENLSEARNQANIDELTGVKNKHAYIDMENMLNRQLEDGPTPSFAIVVMDLNNLKIINDTKGHAAGDAYIKEGCAMICDIFEHSPVFRIGGDEFLAFAMGNDFDSIESRMEELHSRNLENRKNGGAVVAAGYAKCDGFKFVEDMFRAADREMYKNKEDLKK